MQLRNSCIQITLLQNLNLLFYVKLLNNANSTNNGKFKQSDKNSLSSHIILSFLILQCNVEEYNYHINSKMIETVKTTGLKYFIKIIQIYNNKVFMTFFAICK